MEIVSELLGSKFRFSQDRLDHTPFELASIYFACIKQCKIEFQSYILNSRLPSLALEHLKESVNSLKSDAEAYTFKWESSAQFASDIGIDNSSVMDSVLDTEKDTPLFYFVHQISRENYLDIHSIPLCIQLLKESPTLANKVVTQILPTGRNDSVGYFEPGPTKELIRTFRFPTYIIKNLIDYLLVKVYLDALERLLSLLGGMGALGTFVRPQSSVKKGQSKVLGHHLGLLIYLKLSALGFSLSKNDAPDKFASYFLLMIGGYFGTLVSIISHDLDLEEIDTQELKSFLKTIDRITTLTENNASLKVTWFRITREYSEEDLVNLADRTNKELYSETEVLRKWIKLNKNPSCAFNLVYKSPNGQWNFNSEKGASYLTLLSSTYTPLISTSLQGEYRKFSSLALNKFV